VYDCIKYIKLKNVYVGLGIPRPRDTPGQIGSCAHMMDIEKFVRILVDFCNTKGTGQSAQPLKVNIPILILPYDGS